MANGEHKGKVVPFQEAAKAFPFQTFDQITAETISKRWIFKGIMARGETSAWIAPPGGLKSALMAECAVCAANGADWRGARSTGATAVIYFALERVDLVKRRLFAHQLHIGDASLPIAVVASTINLMTPKTVPSLVATMHEVEQKFGLAVGVCFFDTFAKLIAAGGGDEDKARDQGAVFANIQRLKEKVDAHFALVGHTGKDESRGSRGSNAILGDADVMVRIWGDTIRTATIEKANDLPCGPLFAFRSELHDFGVDAEGDSVTVNIISSDVCEPNGTTPPRKAEQGARLPKASQTALRALVQAINELGTEAPASNHIPSKARVVTVEQWRPYAYQLGISAADTTDRAKQQAFKRAVDNLIGSSRVGCWGAMVWLANQ